MQDGKTSSHYFRFSITIDMHVDLKLKRPDILLSETRNGYINLETAVAVYLVMFLHRHPKKFSDFFVAKATCWKK